MIRPQDPSDSFKVLHGGSTDDSLWMRVERDVADRDVLEPLDESEQQQLAEILERYLGELEAGNPVDQDAIVASHPNLASALSQYFASIETLFLAGRAVPVSDSSEPEGDPSTGLDTNLGQSSQLGDYVIKHEIGRGGMGVVYAADQISLGRRVALKTLPFAAVMNNRQVARFKNEAQAAAGLHHPNIVPVYGVGCERGIHYFSMQLIEGQSLEQAIAQLRGVGGKVKDAVPNKTTANQFSTQKSIRSREFPRSVAELGRQAAAALHYAHCSGVVHRDIKPSNLLLDADSKLWITDFGLARIANSSNLTVSGDLIGTVRYMSPEQASGRLHEVDHRTDIYSLGITLYELLTLQPAIDAATRHELLRAVTDKTPIPPRRLNPSIPADLETIVLKAIEKRRDDRYASAGELAEDLEHFLEGRPTLAKRPGWHEHAFRWATRHRKLVTAGVAALSLALLLVSAGALMLRAANDRTTVEAERKALYLRETQRVVDNFGALVDERLEHLPGSTALRAELLGELEKYYSAFLKEAGGDPSFAVDLAITRFRLAAVQERMGDIGGAAEGYQNALLGFEELLRQSPGDLDRLAGVALCHNNLGQVSAKQGDPATAKRHYETSLATYTTLVGAGHRSGQSGLARTTMNLGLLLSSQQDPAAGRVLTQALRTLESLATQSPDDLDVIDQLALCENNLASVILDSDMDRAEALLRSAAARYEQLTTRRPASPDYRSDQALTIGNLAAVVARRGDPQSSIELFDEVRQARERLIELEPDVLSHIYDLAITHQQLGQIMVTLEQWDRAAEKYRESGRLLGDLLARNGADHRAASNLGRVTGNLGMIEARLGNRERAIELLQQAAENQESAIRLSPDDPRYQELLEHHRGQLANVRASDPSNQTVGS